LGASRPKQDTATGSGYSKREIDLRLNKLHYLELEISTMNIFNKMKNKIYNTIRTKYTTQSEQNIQHSQNSSKIYNSQNSSKIYNTVRTVLKYTTQSEQF